MTSLNLEAEGHSPRDMSESTRYVREPDVITVGLKVTTRIRSLTQVTLMVLSIVLGLGELPLHM